MKKYFPILLFIAIFTGFLSGQVFFDIFQTNAIQSTDQKKIHGHYENLLKKSVFKTRDGKEVDLSKAKAPVIIINFWASWCKPCLEEFPSLVAFDKKFSDDDVLIVGIITDDEDAKKDVEKAIKKYDMTFANVEDFAGNILEEFMITAIPVSIIFHKGKVLEISNGAKDFMSGEFLEKVQELIKK